MKSLSHVQPFVTPWTVAHQAPLSMGFSRQEYCSGLPFPSPGDLPDPGIKPPTQGSPALQADALISEPPLLIKFPIYSFLGFVSLLIHGVLFKTVSYYCNSFLSLSLLFLAMRYSLQNLSSPTFFVPPTVEAWGPNHWTTRKFAHFSIFNPSSAARGSLSFLSLDWYLTSLTVRTLLPSSLVLYLFSQSCPPLSGVSLLLLPHIDPSSPPQPLARIPRQLLLDALLTFLSLQRPEPGHLPTAGRPFPTGL